MDQTPVRRRRFLAVWTIGLLGFLGAAIVAPVVAFVTSPLRRKGKGADKDFVAAGPVEGLEIGKWKLLSISIVRQDAWAKEEQPRSVWVLRTGASDFKVLSPICTHLGCPVGQSDDEAEFVCPCHNSIFDHEGKIVSGPAPRGLDALDFQVRQGQLWVRWQDFANNTAERIPVQV